MEKDSEIEILKELLAINSENPPGNEKEMAIFIKDFLESLKIQTELIKFGENRFNLVGWVGKKEGLMLNGHMDTVPVGKIEFWKFNPFGEIVDGKIYGRGAVDMKGGLAAVMAAVKNLISQNVMFKKKLLLVFVGDEEANLGGSKFLIERRKNLLAGIKFGVIAEPTNFTITRAQKGIADFKIIIKGKASHGSRPELGENAIYKACNLIQEIMGLVKKLKKKRDDLLGSGTINVGKICGGTKVNIVPDYCEIEIDRRLIPTETLETAKRQIKEIIRKLKINAKLETLVSRPPMKLPENLELIKVLKRITKKETRGESGYTEAELYYRECGIECVVCGPGNMNLAHMPNEYITISELKRGRKIFESLIKRMCC